MCTEMDSGCLVRLLSGGDTAPVFDLEDMTMLVDSTICLRCAMSVGWSDRLKQAPPAEKALAVETLCALMTQTGEVPPGAEGFCLSGRGHSRFAYDAEGRIRKIPGTGCFPWTGCFVDELGDGACPDFVDAEGMEDAPAEVAPPVSSVLYA